MYHNQLNHAYSQELSLILVVYPPYASTTTRFAPIRADALRWSAKPCVERHHFVCQHNMPMVTDRNRHKVYAKWNASFPNEMANEMEVIVDDRYPG